MKSLNIDIIFPWEVGLVICILGAAIIIIGIHQSKKEVNDLGKIPLVKPTTKIFFGGVFLIFGGIQLLQLIKLF